MATNPSFQGTDVQLTGENPVNNPKPKSYVNNNRFNRSYPHITTAKYGDVTPFYVENGVENDTIPLASRHQVRTPTMKSPFLGDISMKKAYFDVPLRAIYPLNYDLMRVPPVNGDDVPKENTAYIPGSFFVNLNHSMSNFNGNVSWDYVFKMIFLLEKFFSRASLFDYLGCHLSNACICAYDKENAEKVGLSRSYSSFDTWFEAVIDKYFIGDYIIKYNLYNQNYVPLNASEIAFPSSSNKRLSIHRILELIRENPFAGSIGIFDAESGNPYTKPADVNLLTGITINWDSNTDLNIERVVAYQLACCEYLTDDHIDSIYSTDLFRQMMRSYFDVITSDNSENTFVRNGVNFPYDVFSSQFWIAYDYMLSSGNFDLIYSDYAVSYILNLLTIRKSLRYEDYFVGGRLHPLAVGDIDVPVVGGEVNAYEMARSMVYTRFFNSVNLSGPEFDTYSKEILKNTPPPSTDVPKFLAMTMSNVRGYEVENTTSENQGALVTNIKADDERFAFDVSLDHESILIGVCFFEVRRMYSKTVERPWYHIDRYDKFIPKLQHLGDQDISLAELRAGEPLDEPFAYGVRNGEYKQRVGQVSGGVVDFLKSWVMVTDTEDSYDHEDNLNSDYIRSKNVEFDRFFSTSNNSLAGYFHFILEFVNQSTPIRPMEVAPEILM